MANSPHVRLFDCLRAISGNQVLDGQELPCNNYGVKWQLATQEGICLLAAPSCSAEVRGHRLFRKSPFLKHPETGGGPDTPVYLNSMRKMGKIKPTYMPGENNCTVDFCGAFFGVYDGVWCIPFEGLQVYEAPYLTLILFRIHTFHNPMI